MNDVQQFKTRLNRVLGEPPRASEDEFQNIMKRFQAESQSRDERGLFFFPGLAFVALLFTVTFVEPTKDFSMEGAQQPTLSGQSYFDTNQGLYGALVSQEP